MPRYYRWVESDYPSSVSSEADVAPSASSVHSDSSRASSEFSDIERGGKAARQVYETLELRRAIYDLLDRNTLVGLMRLEKVGMACVAEMIYGEINSIQAGKMNRNTVSCWISIQSLPLV